MVEKVDYSRESTLKMDPSPLRAMIRERAHHTVEIQLYEALAEGKALPPGTGSAVRELLAVWKERELPTEGPDFAWVFALLEMAERSIRGEKVDLSRFAWHQYDEQEFALIRRLVHERRAVRHWTDREVPEWMIDEILEAGRWAPHGCNMNSVRFIVVREEHEPGLFKGSDVPGGPVHIVCVQDSRIYHIQPGYVAHLYTLENNRVLDCGATMQNMVLTAHALGLGAVWLTFNDTMRERLRKRFGLGEHMIIVTFLDVGYPDQTPMPPGRMGLDELVLARV